MKKLYEVEAIYYIMAEDEDEAEFAAHLPDGIEVVSCWEIDKIEQVEANWRDAIPFNSDDDRTCAQILNKGEFPV